MAGEVEGLGGFSKTQQRWKLLRCLFGQLVDHVSGQSREAIGRTGCTETVAG